MGRPAKGPGRRLGGRGEGLWEALRASRPFNAAELVMLEELCRMADRLDKMDRLLAGDLDAWVRLEMPNSDKTVVVVLNDAVAEARQLAMAFQRLAASLNLPDAAPVEKTDGIGDLAARRAARLSG